MSKSVTALLGLLTLVGMFPAGCASPVAPMTIPTQPEVEVVHPRRKEMTKTIDLPGDVVGFYEAALHSKVTGYLKTINVDKGDHVRAGQVLAEIEVPELRSNLVRAQASLEIERITYDRLKRVQQTDSRLVSQEDVDMANAKYREAQAAVGTLETMVGYTRIIAPFDGVVTGRFADPGALIRAGGGDIGIDETSGIISPGATEGAGGHRSGGGPILTIADIEKLRIYIYVPEASYPLIHRGTPAVIRFEEFPDQVFNGTVARYASSLDLATRTMLTEVDINNPKEMLYPRSYAHVTIDAIRHPNTLSIPSSAIQRSGDKAHVLTVNDGRLAETLVSTGISDGGYTEIVSGLSDQSFVVEPYSNSLSAGEAVAYKVRNDFQTAAGTMPTAE